MSADAPVRPAGGPAPDEGAPAANEHPWADDGRGKGGSGGVAKRFRFFLAAGVSLALIGALAGVVSWLGRPGTPVFFPIFISQQSERGIPSIPFGEIDRLSMSSGAAFDRVQTVSDLSLSREALMGVLARVEAVSPWDDAVVYLAARAFVNSEGKVGVLPADATVSGGTQPATDSNGQSIQGAIELSSVYEVMEKCRARQKLLILDICNLFVNIPAGVAHFDIPERALAEYDARAASAKAPSQRFHLLLPCDAGQRSHVSRALGGSVFCHFLGDALAGRLPARPGCDGARLGKVFLSEIVDTIGPRIDRWVYENNVERQYPVLRSPPSAGQFVLSVPGRNPPPDPSDESSAGSLEEASDLPKQIEIAWKLLDEFGVGLRATINPRIRSRLFFLALNGTVAHILATNSDKTLARLEADIEKLRKMAGEEIAMLPVPGAYSTLGMLGEAGLISLPDEAARALADAMIPAVAAAAAKPMDSAAATKAGIDGFLKAYPALSKGAAEALAVSVASSIQQPTPLHLEFLAAFVGAHHREAVTAEGRLLVQFAGLCASGQVDPLLARRVLSVNRSVNEVAAKWESYVWIPGITDEMCESCMLGTWLAANSPAMHGAEARARLDSAGVTALFVEGFHEVLVGATGELELSTLDLASLLAFPTPLPAGWREYAERCDELIQMVRKFPRNRSLDLPQAQAAMGTIRVSWKKLHAIRDQIHAQASQQGIADFEKLVNGGSMSTSVLQELDTVGRLYGISWQDRKRLIATREKLIDALAQATIAEEKADMAAMSIPQPLPSFNYRDLAWSPWRGAVELDRLELAHRMISTGGLEGPSMDKLAGIISVLRSGRGDSRTWGRAGALLRTIFLNDIPEFIRQNERMSIFYNMMYPGWLSVTRLDDLSTNPQSINRRVLRQGHISWMETRFRHLTAVGLDPSFWRDQSSLVIGRNSPSPTTEIIADPPPPVYLPGEGSGADVQVRWYLDGPDDLRPEVGLIPSADSPVVAKIMGVRRDAAGGTVAVRLERKGSPARAATARPMPVVIELKAGTRSTPVLINVLPDPAGDLPAILMSGAPDDSSLLGDDILMRGSGSVRKLYPRLRGNPAKASNISLIARLRGREGERVMGPLSIAVPAGAVVPVPLENLLGGAPAGMPPMGTAPRAASPLASSLPATLAIELRDQANLSGPVASREFRLLRQEPADIVEIASATIGADPAGGGATRLRIGLRARRPPLAAPPCRVELALDTRKILRLGPGNTKAVLPADGSMVYLEQGGIVRGPDGMGEGQFTINIDGAPMLFRLRADFRPGESLESAELVRKPYLGLDARYVPPAEDPAGKLPPTEPAIRIECWATSAPEGASLRLDLLGGPGFTNIEKSQVLPQGLRSVVNIKPSEGAAWEIGREESTWRLDWDIEGAKGAKKVRLRLVGAGGEVVDSLEEAVFIDPTPVRFVDISGLPKMVIPGSAYPVVVALDPPESGIRELVAFPGAPVAGPGGRPGPADGAAAFPVTLNGRVATVSLAAPADLKGPLAVSMVATSNAGISSVFTRSIPAGTPRPLAEPSVAGVVSEGGRPQANIEVLLLDAKGMKAGSAKTDEKGQYKIENIKKGAYTVRASKAGSGRSASAKLELEPGPPAKADLVLLE